VTDGKGRVSRWRDAIASYLLALRASRRYGRALNLRRAGRTREALEVARAGLALLSAPEVRRQAPPEGAGVVCLTIEVESLSCELGEVGAAPRDIVDAVEFLRSMPQRGRGRAERLRTEWLPYLEQRLAGLADRE